MLTCVLLQAAIVDVMHEGCGVPGCKEAANGVHVWNRLCIMLQASHAGFVSM